MDEPRPWHRLFGMSWQDFFAGLPVTVEAEKDLSEKQQRLDVVVVRQASFHFTHRPPDGFEEIGPHNLFSFKSFQEAMDGEVVEELIGHGVNYRKQASSSMNDLLPPDDVRLFAICVRSPEKLIRNLPAGLQLVPIKPGVYDLPRHTGQTIRVVVIHELPKEPHNSILLLFSAKEELVTYGADHYRQQSPETSTFLMKLYERYYVEGTPMPFDLKQYTRDIQLEFLEKLAPDYYRSLPSEKRLEWLQTLPAEEQAKLLKTFPVEERLEGLSPEEQVQGLSVETLRTLLRRMEGNDS